MTEHTPDPSVLAAEFALGLLSADETAVAEARLATDPAFRREVELWQERLAGLVDEVPAVRPPESAWAGVSGRIANISPLARKVPSAALYRMPLRWLAAALVVGLGLGAVVALYAPVLFRGGQKPVASTSAPVGELRPAVAVLYPETGAARFVLTTRLGDNRLFIVPTAPWGADPSVPCLWAVDGDADPVFLAKISTQKPSEVSLPDAVLKLASAGVVFVITAEAPDWDPQTSSQGAIVAHGKLEIASAGGGPSL